MIKILKNNRGVTLIEVLSVIALLSIILLLANSFHLFGQKQMINQRKDIKNQTNVRYALNLITKEARSGEVILPVTDNTLSIKTDSTTNVYNLEGTNLLKNGTVLVSDISAFDVEVKEETQPIRIELLISTSPTKEGKTTTLSTVIYNRNEVK